jgi:hypothetical protein
MAKRYRFSVRLMLLVVALVAVTTAYLRTRYDLKRLEDEPHRMNAYTYLEQMRRDRLRATDPRTQRVLDQSIADAEKMFEAMGEPPQDKAAADTLK